MPEFLVAPKLPPTTAAASNIAATPFGDGDSGNPSGPTFATLLQARLPPVADSPSRLKQLSKLLAAGTIPADPEAKKTPADLTATQDSTAPTDLAVLISALFQHQALNAKSFAPTDTPPSAQVRGDALSTEPTAMTGSGVFPEHAITPSNLATVVGKLFKFQASDSTTPSTPGDTPISDHPDHDDSTAETLTGNPGVIPSDMAAAMPLTPPVQTPPITSTARRKNEDTQAELMPRLVDEHSPPTSVGSLHTNNNESQGNDHKPATQSPPTLATAIVAESKASPAETAQIEGKISPDGPGQFQELLAAAQGANRTHGSIPAVTTHVETPVGNPGWGNEVGDKLVWMAHRAESRAELVLNPPQMGRIEVSITLNGDQANAVFVSANQSVRDALEGALPRLREVLADAGIQLDQAQVGADSRGNAANKEESGDNPRRRGTQDGQNFIPGIVPTVSASSRWSTAGIGLVDTFA